MKITINKLRKEYGKAILYEDYEYIDVDISMNFWSLKKVRRAFENHIGMNGKKRINCNSYDTHCYAYMKSSEQGNVEGMFMDDVLSGKKNI